MTNVRQCVWVGVCVSVCVHLEVMHLFVNGHPLPHPFLPVGMNTNTHLYTHTHTHTHTLDLHAKFQRPMDCPVSTSCQTSWLIWRCLVQTAHVEAIQMFFLSELAWQEFIIPSHLSLSIVWEVFSSVKLLKVARQYTQTQVICDLIRNW